MTDCNAPVSHKGTVVTRIRIFFQFVLANQVVRAAAAARMFQTARAARAGSDIL